MQPVNTTSLVRHKAVMDADRAVAQWRFSQRNFYDRQHTQTTTRELRYCGKEFFSVKSWLTLKMEKADLWCEICTILFHLFSQLIRKKRG